MSEMKEISSKNLMLPPLLFGDDEENQEETGGFIPQRARNLIKQRLSNLWPFGRSSEKVPDNSNKVVDQIPQSHDKSCDVSEINQFPKNDVTCMEKLDSDTVQSNGIAMLNEHSSNIFFGVSVFSGNSRSEEDLPLVFSDKKEALRIVKKYKGARFKAFSRRADAIAFASQSADEVCPSPVPKSPILPQVPESSNLLEKTPFKGPKSQEMVKLRKAIEAGDEEYFKETVWSNPRYLISSGDTPAIMQEGFRYNGLHVAAKYKQPNLCELIIDTIEDPKFMELLYYDDSEEVRLQRIAFISDLYLNTPDKGLCEIPLHFAAKFGCLKAVEILASHPKCDKIRKNKYGLTPKDIICERCPGTSPELKKEIEDAFDDRYFVPVLRSDDNSTQPLIGTPYSPENRRMPYTCNSVLIPGSPRDPHLSVKAIAGPMSPKQANDFYQMWKTPPGSLLKASEAKQLHWLRLADTEKGLECVGRFIAQSVKTRWTEYWPVLNTWCNLSSKEGLHVLENHLKNLYNQSLKQRQCAERPMFSSNHLGLLNATSDGSPELNNSIGSQNSSSASSGGISLLCSKLQKFHLNDSGDSMLTSPDMPSILKSHSTPIAQNRQFSELPGYWETLPLNAKKHEEHSSCFGNVQCNAVLSKNKHSSSFLSFGNFSSTNYGNGHLKFQKDQRFSTTKLKCKGDSPVNNRIEVDHINQKKIACYSKATKNVMQSLMEAFSEISVNAEFTIPQKATLHSFLWDNVFPHIRYLLTSSVIESDQRNIVHCDIAISVFEEIKESFMKHEMDLLTRYLTSYLDSNFSVLSSDDENITGREFALSKQKHCKLVKKTVGKHLVCILSFLYEYLSSGSLADIQVSTKCQCEWLDQPMLIDFHVNALMQEDNDSNVVNSASFPCEAHVQAEINLKENDNFFLDFDGGNSFISQNDSSEDDDDLFVTPPSSPVQEFHCYDEAGESIKLDERIEVYVHGSLPSKADVDIVRVIECVDVNPALFPHVSRWKHLITSFDKQIIESWPSPAARNFQRRNSCSKSRTPYKSSLLKFDEAGSSLEMSTPQQYKSNESRLSQTSSFNVRNLEKEFSALEE